MMDASIDVPMSKALEWVEEKLNMDKHAAKIDHDMPRSLLLHYINRNRLVDTRDFKKFRKYITAVTRTYDSANNKYVVIHVSMIMPEDEHWYNSPKVHSVHRELTAFNNLNKHVKILDKPEKPKSVIDVSFDNIRSIKF